MDPKLQVDLIESLPVAKAADVLEKMPADEAADIIILMENEKAELLLNEMNSETSGEVGELLEYSNRLVGSIMGKLVNKPVINIIAWSTILILVILSVILLVMPMFS